MNSVQKARFLWLVPLFLFVITLYQAKLVHDFNRTLHEGTPVEARVMDVELKAMAAQAHGKVTLRAYLPDGSTMDKTLALPVSLLHEMRGRDRVTALYLAGSGQELVAETLIHSQLRMALSNLAVAALGMILVSIGIFAWIRLLKRSGDPGERLAPELAAEQG